MSDETNVPDEMPAEESSGEIPVPSEEASPAPPAAPAPPAPESEPMAAEASAPVAPAPVAPVAPVPSAPEAAMAPPPPPPPPPPYTPPVEVLPLRPGPVSESSKILAALGYLFGVIAIVVLFIDPYKDEKFVKFHAVQAIALWIAGIVASLLFIVPVLGWIAWAVLSVILLVVGIIALIKAFQGEYYEVPVVYGFIKNYVGE